MTTRSKQTAQVEHQPINLTMSVAEARTKLLDRIEKGEQLIGQQIASWDDLDSLVEQFGYWKDFNVELLQRMFNTREHSNNYEAASRHFIVTVRSSLRDDREVELSLIKSSIGFVRSLEQRLDLIPVATAAHARPDSYRPAPTLSNKIFVVHGHDSGIKETVARFLTSLGFEPIILHEQPSMGRTVIEKFEAHADVQFAVILMTPDDEGRAKGKPELTSRARQNVVLELGYFIGRLGRKNVCALRMGDTEVPSDFLGVLYLDIDPNGRWRFELAKEMKAAGLDVDLNRAV